MKDADRIRIEGALEEIDTWRASGIKLKAYAQSRGEELTHWRARLSWERRWRLALAGVPGVAFVRAVRAESASQAKATQARRTASTPMDAERSQDASVRMVVNREGSAMRACMERLLSAAQASGAWLREVLA